MSQRLPRELNWGGGAGVRQPESEGYQLLGLDDILTSRSSRVPFSYSLATANRGRRVNRREKARSKLPL